MAKNDQPIFADARLRGSAFCAAHAAAADEWLASLFDEVVGDQSDVALIAIGGYGRGELWPASDLDVALVHRGRSDIATVAEALWYPIWDRGLKLGYSVLTPKEATPLMRQELDRATAFLSTRHIAGAPQLIHDLEEVVAKVWSKNAYELLDKLAASVIEREEQFGDAAYRLEPDLKEGHGGLRDLHALQWAERAAPGFASDFLEELQPQAEVLTEARVELHRTTSRRGDVLTLDDQEPVAQALGDDNGTELMMRLSQAARRIAWHSDEAWRRHTRRRARTGRSRPVKVLTGELVEAEGQIEIRPGVDIDADPWLLLRVAEVAATQGLPIGHDSLERLASSSTEMPEPWPAEARALFAGFCWQAETPLRSSKPLINST
ncbi:MAG: hypothetical protein R2706_05105 [Acidimicrobiales bacterium]